MQVTKYVTSILIIDHISSLETQERLGEKLYFHEYLKVFVYDYQT